MNRLKTMIAALLLFAAATATANADEPATTTRTYPVADLVFSPSQKGPVRLEKFAALLKKHTGEARWIKDDAKEGEEGTGRASMILFNLSLSLIIRGTDDDHKAVVKHLDMLREFQAIKTGSPAKPTEGNVPLALRQNPWPDAAGMVTRTYPVGDLVPTRPMPSVKVDPGVVLVSARPQEMPKLGEFAERLMKDTGESRWNKLVSGTTQPDPKRGFMLPFNSTCSLIVRGTEADHKAVVERLKALRSTQSPKTEPKQTVK